MRRSPVRGRPGEKPRPVLDARPAGINNRQVKVVNYL